MSLTLHEACLEVQEVLGKPDPMRSVGEPVQRWERELVASPVDGNMLISWKVS